MNPYYTVQHDGSLQYTPEGLARFRERFVEHGIDIGRIRTKAQHAEALAFCAEEALDRLQMQADVCPVDREILMATMTSSDNDRAFALLRERDALKRRAKFRLLEGNE